MSKVGDLRYVEYITVKGDKIIKREKILQQYRKDGIFPSFKFWDDIDSTFNTETRVIDIDKDERNY